MALEHGPVTPPPCHNVQHGCCWCIIWGRPSPRCSCWVILAPNQGAVWMSSLAFGRRWPGWLERNLLPEDLKQLAAVSHLFKEQEQETEMYTNRWDKSRFKVYHTMTTGSSTISKEWSVARHIILFTRCGLYAWNATHQTLTLPWSLIPNCSRVVLIFCLDGTHDPHSCSSCHLWLEGYLKVFFSDWYC